MKGGRRRVIVQCCLWLSVGSMIAQTGAPELSGKTDAILFATAQAQYERQDYKSAQEILRRLIIKSPHNPAINELLGLVLTSLGKNAAATKFFTECVTLNPSSPSAHGNLASNLAGLNENRRAEREFKTALRLDPRSFDLNHNAGEFYAHLTDTDTAIKYLKVAQELSPESNVNGYDLALLEMERGQLQEAESQLRFLTTRVDESGDLHALLGDVYEREENFLGAAAELQHAVQLDPSEANLFQWGAELVRHSNFQAATEVFDRAVVKYPKSALLLIALGVSLYGNGVTDRATDMFCRAIDIEPSSALPYFFLSRIDKPDPGKQPEVNQRLRHFLELKPKSAAAHLYYAKSLWADNGNEAMPSVKKEQVKRLLQQALLLEPNLAEAHFQLGTLYASEQDSHAAMREFTAAVKFDPLLETAHYRLARTLIASGEKQRGEEELKRWSTVRSSREEQGRKLLTFVYSEAKR